MVSIVLKPCGTWAAQKARRPPARHALRLKAETLGFDLAGAEGRGEVEILWHPVGEHILTGRATLNALIPLYDQLKRRGTVRQETVTDALRAWRRLVPAQGRLSIKSEQRGRHARIEEVRL